MHDHVGHLNLVADKAIFADSWNEGGQKPSKEPKSQRKENTQKHTIFPDSLEGGGPSQDSLNIVFVYYQATACSRRPARDRTLALALLYVSLSLKP